MMPAVVHSIGRSRVIRLASAARSSGNMTHGMTKARTVPAGRESPVRQPAPPKMNDQSADDAPRGGGAAGEEFDGGGRAVLATMPQERAHRRPDDRRHRERSLRRLRHRRRSSVAKRPACRP